MINSLQELNNIFELAEKRMSRLEDRFMIMQSKEEEKNEHEQSPREMWNTIKHTNMCKTGVPEEE